MGEEVESVGGRLMDDADHDLARVGQLAEEGADLREGREGGREEMRIWFDGTKYEKIYPPSLPPSLLFLLKTYRFRHKRVEAWRKEGGRKEEREKEM